MKLVQEFKAFALKGNVVDLAVAVVIGGAFGKIVTAFVDDLIMPIVSRILPGGSWRTAAVTPLAARFGRLLGAMLDFLIVALVVFLTLVKLLEALKRRGAAEASAPATKTCGECLESIPV